MESMLFVGVEKPNEWRSGDGEEKDTFDDRMAVYENDVVPASYFLLLLLHAFLCLQLVSQTTSTTDDASVGGSFANWLARGDCADLASYGRSLRRNDAGRRRLSNGKWRR